MLVGTLRLSRLVPLASEVTQIFLSPSSDDGRVRSDQAPVWCPWSPQGSGIASLQSVFGLELPAAPFKVLSRVMLQRD
jgi:hypothetical protein